MKKVGCILIFLSNLIFIFYLWFNQSGAMLFAGPAPLFISLGRICGLAAVYLILWQLILIGRVKILEQAFGFDRLSLGHHFNGLLAWLFIFLHPLFLTLGYGLSAENTFLAQLLFFLFGPGELFPAFASLFLFFLTITISWAAIKKFLKYEAWYYIHLLTYLAIIFAFGHQLETGGDLQKPLFSAYWIVLYTEAVFLLVYFRFLKPAWLFWRHRFMVDRWERLNEQTISIYIKGRELDSFRVKPGQFAIFRFFGGCLAFQAHPFSFSGANDRELRITVKALGDYTENLPEKIKEGAPVIIDGPHGTFTLEKTKKEKLVFIAGGIGITPFRMLAEQAIADGRDVVLLCGAKKRRELVFKDELEGLAGDKLRLVWVLSDEIGWPGESGRIDEEKIKRLVPDYAERAFFLCGPGLMTQSLRRTLKQLRIKEKDIYFEKFSLS